MIKIIKALLIGIILSSSISNAQIKAYSFPSDSLNERTISNILIESRKKGTQEWEVQRLKEHLYQRLYKKNIYLKGPPPQVQAACTNVDFEQGNCNGWTLTSGNISGISLPCNTCASGAGGIANVTTSVSTGSCWTTGVDNCTGQPALAPNGGVYSLCLNDRTAGSKMQEIKQTFLISASNNLFTYQYLAVLEDGGHAATDQPYFMSQVLDGSGAVIPCTYVLQSASAAISGWTPAPNCPNTNYKGWITVTLDLTSYLTQNLTIDFLVSDCNQGGHFGYCYIDADCSQLNANNTVTVCAGTTQLCGPVGFNTYNWTGPVTGNTVCLNGATAGAYTLVTTGQCPAPTRFYTVTISPSPTVVVNSTAICSGSISTLTASGANSYLWSTGATTSTISASPIITTTYTVIGTINLCTDTAISTITVTQTPTITVNNATICSGSTIALISSGSGSYLWSTGATTSTINVSPLVTTTYTVIGSINLCADTSISTVTVNQTPTVTVNSTTICSGSTSTLTANGANSYIWSTGATSSTIVVSPSASTTYTVIGSISLCADTSISTITVNQTPTITVNNATICSGNSAILTAAGSINYIWTPSAGINQTTGSVVTTNPSTSTTYTIIGTSNGCSDTTLSMVTVNQTPTVTINSPTYCTGNSSTLTANGATSYNWSPSAGLSSTTGSTVSVNILSSTTYTIIGTSNGCADTTLSMVTVNQTPTSIVGPNASGCSPVCVNFTNISSPGTYSWNFGDTQSSTSQAPSHCYATQGSYHVTFTVTNSNGCTSTSTNTIIVYPNPISQFSASPNVTDILNPQISFTNLSSPGSYTWSLGDNTTIINIVDPMHIYHDVGSYTVQLIVKTQYGCADTSYGVIIVNDVYSIYVPNAFTPNGDGVNELFFPAVENCKNYQLDIFDRWGLLLYHSSENGKWDGTYKGYIVQEDVYIWKIVLRDNKNTEHSYSGHVSVVK